LHSSFKLTFGVEFSQEKLRESEKERVGFFLNEKYKTKEWNNYKILENA